MIVTPQKVQVAISYAIAFGAAGYGIWFIAWWRGWRAGRREEREGWSMLLKRPCKPPREQLEDEYRFENGSPFRRPR